MPFNGSSLNNATNSFDQSLILKFANPRLPPNIKDGRQRPPPPSPSLFGQSVYTQSSISQHSKRGYRMTKSLILLSVVGGTLFIDQVSKYVARYYLENEGMFSYFFDTVRFDYYENSGAFLGLGESLSPFVKTLLFSVFASSIILGLAIWVLRTRTVNFLTIVACGLIIGGGGGNVVDRILNEGAVMDFINMGVGEFRTGVFNVADMAILSGIGAMVFGKITAR